MRLIKDYDPKSITAEFLNSLDWDLIELNKTVDPDGMLRWYGSIEETMTALKFNFRNNLDLIQNKISQRFLTDADGSFFDAKRDEFEGVSSYSLKWIIQRKQPLPPPWAANTDIFDELLPYKDNTSLIDVNYDNFYSKTEYLEWYMFGEFKRMIDEWGSDVFYNPRISVHHPGTNLKAHKDKAYIGRVHIPITHDDSLFCWGENLERKYKLKPGNIYFINSRVTHGTITEKVFRANFMADVVPGKEIDIVRL